MQILYTTENPSPATYFFLTVSTTEPRLRLSELSASDKKQVRDNLIAGRTGGWSVDAYDDQERRVGVSLTERRFLVAEPLGD